MHITAVAGLAALLAILDRRLAAAVDVVERLFAARAGGDLYRGLAITPADIEAALARVPGAPFGLPSGQLGQLAEASDSPALRRLCRLQQVYGLSDRDVDILVIGLAPEVDLRYERLYAYLQDDVSRRRPTVDLALNLICTSAEDKLAQRKHFAADAPLIRERLIHLLPDPHAVYPPLLAHDLKLDEQIVRLILGEDLLDSRLASFCEMMEPRSQTGRIPLDEAVTGRLRPLLSHAWATRRALILYLQGPSGVGKRGTARVLAGEIGARLLVVNLRRAPTTTLDFERAVRILLREALFRSAIVYVEGLDELGVGEGTSLYRVLMDALEQNKCICILAGERSWVPDARGPKGVLSFALPIPAFADRRAFWQGGLADKEVSIAEADLLDALADRFRLTPAQIADAVETASRHACCRAANDPEAAAPQPTPSDLFAAARAQSGHALAALARKIEPSHSWDDLVLPEDTLAQLQELCQRVVHHHRVLGDWGFARKLTLGKGVNALFAGPSGTGKTMAAEIIAGELCLDLYRIDLSQVVSKYIGETEKNLNRVFAAAENANAILFFDEADALFGKRSEVRDAHDRYANIEIAYLLQKMEEYDGLAILASNLSQNLDDAFTRRLAFVIQFPFPDECMRRRIWAGVWPAEAPLSEDLHFDVLANRFRLSGGNIRNVALSASFLAAADGKQISLVHVLQATRREYQKLGRVASEAEFGAVAGASA